MSLILVIALLGVLGAIAVAAAGRGGSLDEAAPDRSPHGMLPEGDIDRGTIRALRFSLAFRGYRMDEVDTVLDRLIAELESRDRRIAELEGREPHREAAPGG